MTVKTNIRVKYLEALKVGFQISEEISRRSGSVDYVISIGEVTGPEDEIELNATWGVLRDEAIFLMEAGEWIEDGRPNEQHSHIAKNDFLYWWNDTLAEEQREAILQSYTKTQIELALQEKFFSQALRGIKADKLNGVEKRLAIAELQEAIRDLES
jgi:tagatose-1,6-bisphosphate aldolase non-catalytic subunit AgaZ/GatZ